MAGSSNQLHEDPVKIGAGTIDRHRAIVSLMEELEAVDWYDQRAAATDDAELKKVLEHNRDEEKEHAVMTLEWLRRRDPELDRVLRTYLFSEGSITEIEESETGEPEAAGLAGGAGSLAIGSLLERGGGAS